MNLDLNLVENLTDKNTSRMHAFALLQLQRIDSQICKNSKPLKVKVEVWIFLQNHCHQHQHQRNL